MGWVQDRCNPIRHANWITCGAPSKYQWCPLHRWWSWYCWQENWSLTPILQNSKTNYGIFKRLERHKRWRIPSYGNLSRSLSNFYGPCWRCQHAWQLRYLWKKPSYWLGSRRCLKGVKNVRWLPRRALAENARWGLAITRSFIRCWYKHIFQISRLEKEHENYLNRWVWGKWRHFHCSNGGIPLSILCLHVASWILGTWLLRWQEVDPSRQQWDWWDCIQIQSACK